MEVYPLVSSNMACWKMHYWVRRFSRLETFIYSGFPSQPCLMTPEAMDPKPHTILLVFSPARLWVGVQIIQLSLPLWKDESVRLVENGQIYPWNIGIFHSYVNLYQRVASWDHEIPKMWKQMTNINNHVPKHQPVQVLSFCLGLRWRPGDSPWWSRAACAKADSRGRLPAIPVGAASPTKAVELSDSQRGKP